MTDDAAALIIWSALWTVNAGLVAFDSVVSRYDRLRAWAR